MATEITLRRAVWHLRIVGAFVVCGGYFGGLAVIVTMSLVALAASAVGYGGDVSALLRSIIFTPLFALFGIVFGFPAALVTALIFLFGPPTWRGRVPLTFVGAGAGALWALAMFCLMGPITPHSDFGSLAGSTVLFAIAGATAAFATLWLLERWKLLQFAPEA